METVATAATAATIDDEFSDFIFSLPENTNQVPSLDFFLSTRDKAALDYFDKLMLIQYEIQFIREKYKASMTDERIVKLRQNLASNLARFNAFESEGMRLRDARIKENTDILNSNKEEMQLNAERIQSLKSKTVGSE